MNGIETNKRPAPQGDSALPDELVQWLEERGLRPSWQPYNENYLNQLFGRGFEPLTADTIKESDEELYKKLFVGEPGVRRLIAAKDTGYIRNFDAVLMIQPVVSWEQMEEETRSRLRAIEQNPMANESQEELMESLKELLSGPGVTVQSKKARSAWAMLEDVGGN